MAGKTYFNDVYRRAQIAFGTEKMNQVDLVDWLTGGTIVTDKSLGVRILATDMENKAVEEIEFELNDMGNDIEQARDFKSLNRQKAILEEKEDSITIDRLKNDLQFLQEDLDLQREAVSERNKQVSFFNKQFNERFNDAESLEELSEIANEAEETAQELSVENIRKFSGLSFERNSKRFL